MDPAPLASDEPGAARALELGLERELPGLRAYLVRLAGGTRGEADDLAQEVLARALRYRHAFDPSRPLGPWLRRAALRVYLDQRERERREPRAAESEAGVADGREEPREALARREEVELLLERLAPVERDALLRFHRAGESVREIARALGLPAGTVRSHLHRARRKLAAAERGEEGHR